jgi:hypothetical protein
MQDMLDTNLARLTAQPVPVGLDGLEDRVLARIAAAPPAGSGRSIRLLGGALALLLGVASGGMLAPDATAAHAAAPIGLDGALAPSTLLLGR